jgi:hypothetical protein
MKEGDVVLAVLPQVDQRAKNRPAGSYPRLSSGWAFSPFFHAGALPAQSAPSPANATGDCWKPSLNISWQTP